MGKREMLKNLKRDAKTYQLELDQTKGLLWLLRDSGLPVGYDPTALTDYSYATNFEIQTRDLSRSSSYHDMYKFPQFYAKISVPNSNTKLYLPVRQASFERSIPKMAFQRDHGSDSTYMAHSERVGHDSNKTTYSLDECLEFFTNKGVPQRLLSRLKAKLTVLREMTT